jgi:hypothetical protein
MICNHYAICYKDKNSFVTDIFGAVEHFSSFEAAEQYIEDNELEDVEIVPQF